MLIGFWKVGNGPRVFKQLGDGLRLYGLERELGHRNEIGFVI